MQFYQEGRKVFKQVVPVVHVAGSGPAQEAVIVADSVGIERQAPRRQHFPGIVRGQVFGPFHNHRRAHVAKDEMAVPVAPLVMTGGDFGVDHQDRPCRAAADHVCGGLDAERRRGTGDIHVEGETVDAQRLLDFDGDRRVSALVV
jgi:hypothetical protein